MVVGRSHAKRKAMPMRDHPVPCVNASPSQVMRGHHFTYMDDRVCTRCRPSSTAFGREAGGRHGMARLPAGPTEEHHA